MRRKTKIVVLSLLAITLLLWASLETFHLYSAFHYLKVPNSETREPFGHNVHSWMNVEEAARCYDVTPSEIFTALAIQPETGDEHLSLKHLAEKYHKTPAEMEAVFNQFNSHTDMGPNRGRN
jgi:hypothetical protein